MEADTATAALPAYQAILQKHGYGKGDIYKHTHIARCILAEAGEAEPDGQIYREAVDKVLDTMPDEAARELCMRVVRGFFPFFMGDVQAIALMSQSGAFEREQPSIKLPPHEGLDDLIAIANQRELNESEELSISDYSYGLQGQGFNDQAIINRLTVGRLLLLGMRDLPRDGKHYRAVTDRLLELFSQEKTREYFMSVAREFYGFLLGNPNAKIVLSLDLDLHGDASD